MDYRNYPIFRVLISLLLGIILAHSGALPFVTPMIGFLTALLLCILSSAIYVKIGYNWQWTAGIGILLAALLVGFGAAKFRLSPSYSPAEEQYIEQHRHYVVTITEPPQVRTKSVKMKVLIEKSTTDTVVRQQGMLYVSLDSTSAQLRYGDRLLINSQIKEIEPPKNPDEFDYKDYMHRKGIYYTGYVPAGHWKKIGRGPLRRLKAESYKLQQYFSRQFAIAGVSGDQYAVITAILLGNDETMEPELRSRYASAGVSHILCVSGMHVGIIYMILNFLLKPLDLYRRTRYVKAGLLLSAIWFYAHITGLSPSVTRAATMFTFVAVGGVLRRNTDIFHSLYASLFILLIINPLWLFEIGFQLSYLAVFGIVIFQPMIASILKPRTKVGNYFNELASVSLAAQLTTFPVSVACFGQFPNYFLLANLSVIALSFMVVVTGVLLLSVSFWPLLAKWVGYVLGFEIKSMNGIIAWINTLPGSVSNNLKLDDLQVVIIYLVIFLFVAFLKTTRRPFFRTAMALSILLPITLIKDKIEQTQRCEMIVYSIDKTTAINFNDGGRSILLADSSAWPEGSIYNFSIKNHGRQSRMTLFPLSIEDTLCVKGALAKIGSFVRFHNMTLYILERGKKLYPMADRPEVDYLVLSHSPQIDPNKVAQSLRFKQVIIDQSNSPYYRERWLHYCRLNHIKVYNLLESGFLRVAANKKSEP